MQQRKAERQTSETMRNLGDNAAAATNRAQASALNGLGTMRDFQLKLVSAAQDNMNSFFEYASEALQAQSMQDLVEATTRHSNRQLEIAREQARELTESAQRIAGNGAGPLMSMFRGGPST